MPSLFSKLLATTAYALDRSVGWHRLPRPLGILTLAGLRTRARRLQRRHGIGLIIVDYLQLLQGSSRSGDNRVQEISESGSTVMPRGDGAFMTMAAREAVPTPVSPGQVTVSASVTVKYFIGGR